MTQPGMTQGNQVEAWVEALDLGEVLSPSQEESILVQYRADRRESGVVEADRVWLRSPLKAWFSVLEGAGVGARTDASARVDVVGQTGAEVLTGLSARTDPGNQDDAVDQARGVGVGRCMTRAEMAALGILIGETLPIRDGLIVSLMHAGDDLDFPRLLDLCLRPHRPGNVTLLCETLDSAFKDRRVQPDLSRCRAGLLLLGDMARYMCPGHKAQSRAVAAYTLWWMGGDGAADKAQEALADDGHCSLAAIVLSLTIHGILPAWKESG